MLRLMLSSLFFLFVGAALAGVFPEVAYRGKILSWTDQSVTMLHSNRKDTFVVPRSSFKNAHLKEGTWVYVDEKKLLVRPIFDEKKSQREISSEDESIKQK